MKKAHKIIKTWKWKLKQNIKMKAKINTNRIIKNINKYCNNLEIILK